MENTIYRQLAFADGLRYAGLRVSIGENIVRLQNFLSSRDLGLFESTVEELNVVLEDSREIERKYPLLQEYFSNSGLYSVQEGKIEELVKEAKAIKADQN